VTPLERVRGALADHGSRRSGPSGWTCPAHDDRQASLSVTATSDGKVILNCHADCESDAVVRALGLQWADLFPQAEVGQQSHSTIVATYGYVDERSRPLFEVVRFAPKDFRQRRSNRNSGWIWNLRGVRRVLYRLPRVLDAVAMRKTIYVVEGEKDVHALEQAGAVATCNPGGAGKWHEDYAQVLAGASVVVVADRDEVGRKHASTVATSLTRAGCAVQVVEAAEGKDATDHLAGHTLNELVPVDLASRPPQQAASNGQGAQPVERRLLFTPASEITPRPVRWVWDTTPAGAHPTEQGRFPAGSLVLAVGRAGLGKSQFAVWAAAQITRGALPGCHYGTPHNVVYCATEDSWEMTIVPRLMAAGADLDRVFHVRAVDDDDPHARLTLPEDTRLMEAGIGTHDVVLVVLDPLLSLLHHEINDYRAREVRTALEPVGAVADRTRCLFLGLAHFTKATGNDPLMLVSGSGAFGQLIRAGVGFARDEEADGEALVLSQIKNNLGREDLPSLKYEIQPASIETPEGTSYVSKFRFTGEESERSVRDLLRGSNGEDPDAKTERDEAVEWLRELLEGSDGQMPAKEVKAAARAAGIPERTLDRARPRAGVSTKREGFGKDAIYIWRLASTPHERHVRQHSEGGEHGAHGGEHDEMPVPVESPSPPLEPAPPQREGRRLLDPGGDAPRSATPVWRCAGCGHTTTAFTDMTGFPHPECGGRFQASEEAA
jgi:5S rRNA maturation endonuclease (ribonuclease M5)